MADEYDPYDDQDGSGVPDGLPLVELEFATLRRFREEMAPYLNYDGFFARTDRPLPRGTSVEFKFVMPEDFVLANGTAVVSWAIEPEGNPDLVPGMALRFGQVGKQSRAVIDELVDFHIATGGDPFDVGPHASWAGDIPTDALAGTGGGAPSIIDSPAPKTRDLPLPPDPEEPALAEDPVDDVLPDWLSGSAGAKPATRFEMPSEPKKPVPTVPTTEGFDFSSDLSSDEFDVDMIFDNGGKDTTPLRREDGSYHQMAMAPRAEDKPPRDIRVGLIVTAGIVVVAMVVLGLTYWLRNSDREIVEAIPQENTAADVGVELIDDDADLLIEETPSEGAEGEFAETAGETTTETASRVGAELASEDPGEPLDAVFAGEPVDSGPATAAAAPTKVFVTEQPTDAMPPPVAQGRASQVVDVAAAAQGDVTTVVIRGNGAFEPSSIRSLRLADPMRVWLSVAHIETFFKPNEIDVGSREIERVRIGYHPEDSPPALYIVLDLAGDDVFLLDTSVQGDAIRLTVGRK
jgi:hypothetical protein